MDKCAICGMAHASCGPRTTVVPIDERIALRKGDGMADLKNYRVKVATRGDRFVETTLLLSDEDAKRQGLSEKDLVTSKPAPANKAATPAANKSRARAPRTKAKTEPKTAAASDTTPAADDTAQGEQTPAE